MIIQELTMRVSIFFVALFGIAVGQSCESSNCAAPDCRCFSDNDIPGGLSADEIPQMVVFTMDYSLNSEFSELYDQLFVMKNPNDCPALGTFYLQDANTDYKIVQSYYERGFEIGVSSVDGSIPKDDQGWISLIKSVKDKIVGQAQVGAKDVRGYRAPQLSFGGTDQFIVCRRETNDHNKQGRLALIKLYEGVFSFGDTHRFIGIGDNDLVYDAGCITSQYDTPTTYKWPYTYDFKEGAKCNGQTSGVDKEFVGKWQLLIPDFKFKNNTRCEVPQGCTTVETKQDAFDILYDNFIGHYEGNRSPYIVIIDAAWMKTDFKREGTVEFVEYLKAAFPDVYQVTAWQALQWVQDPTPTANITNFPPWQC